MRVGLVAQIASVVVAVLVGTAVVAPGLRAQGPDARQMATGICASCHGPTGRSVSSAFPTLAGQTPEYLTVQLKAFRDRTRADPMAQAYMWGMSSQLSDDRIAQLAAYYSKQKPARGTPGDPMIVKMGQSIFEDGIPSAKVAACATCHVANGGVTPNLTGQHPEYLLKQLALFNLKLRLEANSPEMHAVSVGMTFEQMQAVVAYLASR
jgi:cytochrome c553